MFWQSFDNNIRNTINTFFTSTPWELFTHELRKPVLGDLVSVTDGGMRTCAQTG